jgi:hypothetical protein
MMIRLRFVPSTGRVVVASDLPSEADEPARAERPGDGGADRSKARELPDPDERSRAYEALRAHVSAETPPGASPDRRPDAGGQQGYWDEVPRFRDAWADHERRWPKRPQTAADRSGDRPELPAATAETVRRIREVERTLSADAQEIGRENKHGGWLEGFEHRFKGEDRLKEKIAEKMAAEPRMTTAGALREVADVIRYTYCFQPEDYTRGYYDTKERFESVGHEMYYSQNWWTNLEYKGINTRWVTAGGQRFEVQFHTPESFHAKHYVTHLAYERIRDPTTSRAELRDLHAFQREVCSPIQVPDGATDIPNYRKEGF